MENKELYMENEKRKMSTKKKIVIFGGSAAILTGIAVAAASCGSETEAKLDKEGSLSDVTTSITKASTTTELTTTAAKTFVTTTKSGVETTIPVESDTNGVDVTYDTTIEAPVDSIPENLVNVSGNNNNVDVNVIINAPVYSISAESVDVENGDQIIYDEDMDSFNENKDSYNGSQVHENAVAVTVATTEAVSKEEAKEVSKEVEKVVTTTTTTTTTKAEEVITEDTEALVEVEYPAAVVTLTDNDIKRMADEFTNYVNETADFKHTNYVHGKFNITDMYSVIYLTNIDYVDKETTKKLINDGFIYDSIEKNIENAYNFFGFYINETVNKVQDGRTDIIDLSKAMIDKNGKKVAKTMNKVLTGFTTNSKSKNLKNFKDVLYFEAEGISFDNANYDYKKSIFTTDKEQLGIGADFALDFAAISVKYLAINNQFIEIGGKIDKDFDNIIFDNADLVQTFNEYTKGVKCYSKK